MPSESVVRDPDPLDLVHFGDERDIRVQLVREQRASVMREQGWIIACVSDVEGARPPIAYTIGLTETAQHAELVMVGVGTDPEVEADGSLHPSLAEMLLRLLAERVTQEGAVYAAGDRVQLLPPTGVPPTGEDEEGDGSSRGLGATLRAVHPAAEDLWLVQLLLRYRPQQFTALQVVLADPQGRFPWDAGCDPDLLLSQPLLDQVPPEIEPQPEPRELEPRGRFWDPVPTGAPGGALGALAREAAEQMLRQRRLLELALRTSQEKLIGDYGWMVQGVFADATQTPPKPPHSYTIGLLERFDHPEIAVTGLSFAVAQSLLNDLGKRIAGDPDAGRAGERLADGQVIADIANFPAVLRAIHPSHFAAWFGRGVEQAGEKGKRFAALQLVWPDPQGHFPWDAEFDEAYRLYQPPLYEPPQD